MFKVHRSHINGWNINYEEVATFNSLRKAYDYVHLLVKDSNGEFNHYSFTITETKNRKWYERRLFSKKSLSKTYEQIWDWNTICYWLDNHIVE